jgi:5'-nucleotidase
VVSGINHGSNASVSAIYSGTVSAATEGTMMGIPSMAVSLSTLDPTANMDLAAQVAVSVAQQLLEIDLPLGTLLNVNVPNIPAEDFKGIRVTRQGHSQWRDYYEVRTDPHGRPYYWLAGTLVPVTELEDADDLVVKQGWAAVTPIHYELTNVHYLETLQEKLRR